MKFTAQVEEMWLEAENVQDSLYLYSFIKDCEEGLLAHISLDVQKDANAECEDDKREWILGLTNRDVDRIEMNSWTGDIKILSINLSAQ